MYVRMNFGPHAGQDVDLAPEAAVGLLADGRASRAFQPAPPAAAPVAAGPVSGPLSGPVSGPQPPKKKRRA